ncbi:MAG: putative membrane-bound dehydrogenase-like protein, partial [Rhodothermales bacterium]
MTWRKKWEWEAFSLMRDNSRARATLSAFALIALPGGPLRLLLIILLVLPLHAEEPADGSAAAKSAISSMQLAGELEAKLVAAEPALQNAVAFDIDERGRFFVAESFRAWDGVPDIRPIRSWQDDDLACRTVEDRLQMMIKHAGDLTPYTLKTERIRRLADTDGDGVVDEVITFAEGFNDPLDGIGAGVYAANGEVWFTCIPKLWRLTDADDDGVAETRKSLHHGYGVHINLLGHDLHGVIMGPDGKLYFSIGDRGINVPSPSGRLVYPDEGSVLRCNPDGSELELYARGMRNPQELAFDDYGNLFTVDNDADGEDSARFVYIIRGHNAGWHIGHQWVGPSRLWNREKMWELHFPDQPAHILPPAGHITNGPSGFAAFPGTGLPQRYNDHFFVADFTGSASNSGIHAFRMSPLGATFRMDTPHHFAWGMVPTDFDFGIDGGAYILDWVGSYSKPDKSRIYRIADSANLASTETQETTLILRQGIAHRDSDELAVLLAHADRRIRQAAQFELVSRGETERLVAIALNPSAYRGQYSAAQHEKLSDKPDQTKLLARQAIWEDKLRTRTRWSPLHPTSARSEAGALLSIQPDGAVLAGGPAPENDTVTLSAVVALENVTALRLEALPHRSLPENGPGRSDTGDFVLSTVSLAIQPLDKPKPEPVLGRTLRVQRRSSNPLTIAECEIWSDGVNIALEGYATQSSTGSDGDASRGIDGNTQGVYSHGFATHTKPEDAAWWEVDLHYEQPIDSITLWNRTDCCQERLADVRVTILDEIGNEVWGTDIDVPPKPSVTLTVRDTGIRPIVIDRAEASFARVGFPANDMIASSSDYDGWSISPRAGEPHTAIFHLAEPLSVPGGARLRITMAHDYWQSGSTLGHFRFSSSTHAAPTLESAAPPEILRIVDTSTAERDPAESAALHEFYALRDPILAQAHTRLEQLDELDEVEIWFDDELPEGGTSNPPESIDWVESPVHSGTRAHRLKPGIRANQHYFDKATAPLVINHLDDEL